MPAAAAETVDTTTVAWIAVLGTLAGAFIGATTGGGIDYLLERTRARKRALIGARLIRSDFAFAARKMRFAERDEAWFDYYDTKMGAWSKYEEAVADRLNGNDFKLVHEAAVGLAWWNDFILRTVDKADADHIKLDTATIEIIRTLRQELTTAYNVLAPLAKDTRAALLGEDSAPQKPDRP